MMNSNYIIDVNEADFEFEVLNFSQNTPVIVDFWAVWCKPCKVLSPILENLVIEANGGFRLARVNVDDNPNLVLRYGVRTIPTVKAISQGHVVGEFIELQPEHRIREFLAKIIPPSPLNLAIEKADSLLESFDLRNAEDIYLEILDKHAENPSALLGLAKIYLISNRASKAFAILSDFPESRLYAKAEVLKPLAKVMVDFNENLLPGETDLDNFFHNCVRLIQRQNLPAALDGLLDIIRENRGYRNGLARDVFLALLEILGEHNPQTRKYRSELATTLF